MVLFSRGLLDGIDIPKVKGWERDQDGIFTTLHGFYLSDGYTPFSTYDFDT